MWFCTASALWRINRRLEHVNLLDEKWPGVRNRGAVFPEAAKPVCSFVAAGLGNRLTSGFGLVLLA